MKDGVHSIPMEQYLLEPAVNQSSLKRMARSPAHFRHYVDNPQTPTRSQIVGTVFHTAVLQPELLEGSYHLRPETYGDGKKWNGNANECRDWLAKHADKPVLKREENDNVMLMRNYVLEHPGARAALAHGKSELSLFATDPETGVPLKCRADRLSGNNFVELKSCEDASPSGFQKAIVNFGYEIQRAFSLHIAELLGLQKEHWIFVAAESEAPFAVAVYELLDPEEIGRTKFRRLLKRYKQCVDANSWPAFSPNIEFLGLPKWAVSQESYAQQLEDRPAVPALEV